MKVAVVKMASTGFDSLALYKKVSNAANLVHNRRPCELLGPAENTE